MFLETISLLFITLVFYKLYLKFAKRYDLVDVPNSRSSHETPTFKGFGVVIFCSIILKLLIFNPIFFVDNIFFLGAVSLIFLLGLFDDLYDVSPIIKIITLIIAYIFLYAEGFLITNLGIFFGISIQLYLLFAICFTLFSIIAFTNAFNLIDGLDGLAGVISLVILVSFFYIGVMNDDQFLIIIPSLFIIPLIIFIIFNWHPAKIFLGDSGSLMIGLVISLLSIKSLEYIEPISILFIAGIPIIDSIFVFSRRLINGGSPFTPDKNHMHHIILNYNKNNTKRTVFFIGLMQLTLSILGIFVVANVPDSFIFLMVFIALILIVYQLLIYLKLKKSD
jgi:UDP-GlcNAc:undecaprenyl-phosphate/decaprenyl-phosphate GlcNAc-1-phosphate transferase